MLELNPNLKQKRLPSELRREQLLAYAMMCYADLGVMRAGHGDVAKRANLSTATVFNYFPTRSALTQAVFQEVYNVFDKMSDARIIMASAYGYTRMKLDGAEQEVLDRFTARVLSALSDD